MNTINNKINIVQNSGDSHQSQPWCVALFMIFNNKDTFYNSSNTIGGNPMEVSQICVVSDILSASVNQNKRSPEGQGNIILSSGVYNYQTLLSPSDHVIIWMGDDATEFNTLISNISQGRPCNYASSGLKFMGKINSVRSIFTQDPGGQKTLRYNITVSSFTEFNTQFFYNIALQNSNYGGSTGSERKMIEIYSQISQSWTDFLQNDDSGRAYLSHYILMFYVNVFLGQGPTADARYVGSLLRSPNAALQVPQELNTLMNGDIDSSPNYNNILNRIVGIQEYENTSYLPDSSFSPVTSGPTTIQAFRTLTCTNILTGNLSAPPMNFNSFSVWQILQEVSNPSLNEIYTTLKVNSSGDISPTFVARQIPFTSIYMNTGQVIGNSLEPLQCDHAFTRMVDLPRWVIDPSMALNGFNFGTSNSSKFNFWSVNGMFVTLSDKLSAAETLQVALGNYRIDERDIYRNGSRNLLCSTNNSIISTNNEGSRVIDVKSWTNLVTDFYASNHLKLSGNIELTGISAPICIGDNMEIENKIFHIESVTHNYNCTAEGKKSFRTLLDLSNGVNSDGTFVYQSLALDRATIDDSADVKGAFYPGYSSQNTNVSSGQSKVLFDEPTTEELLQLNLNIRGTGVPAATSSVNVEGIA
jgi:hypothetical protein